MTKHPQIENALNKILERFKKESKKERKQVVNSFKIK